MTYEEAIKELKSYAEHSWGGLAESFECAIEAMEKQIPKKPISLGLDPACSECETYIFPKDRYCPRCGQVISWK